MWKDGLNKFIEKQKKKAEEDSAPLTLMLSGNWISSLSERQGACPVATVGAELWDR